MATFEPILSFLNRFDTFSPYFSQIQSVQYGILSGRKYSEDGRDIYLCNIIDVNVSKEHIDYIFRVEML